MGSCLDLRKYQDLDSKEGSQVADMFSQIVSGKKGYKAVIERKKELPRCTGCMKMLEGNEKFCPECGTKISMPTPNVPTPMAQ